MSLPLKNTHWISKFYHYQNKYFFETDSTGSSQDGQLLWSTPVDTALYHNSMDSIMFYDPRAFVYSLKDTVLTIVYKDTSARSRSFHWRKDTAFVSVYEYTYGHEVLFKNGGK
jgi:hypothetical protein